MFAAALQSGSNGNCLYVEAGGRRLLIDSGISGRQAELRLASLGRDIRDVDAVLISHDHSDHARCAGIYSRKFHLPVYVTEATLDAAGRERLGRIDDLRHFRAGESLEFGDLRVETVCTPHDGVDGVAFVLDDGRRRLGVLTDLGHVFDRLVDLVTTLDAVLIESNYDPDMLASGPYPPFLQERITGRGGHLSNIEAAGVLADGTGRRLQWACIGHLSEQNNEPSVALDTHRDVLGRSYPLLAASRHEARAFPEI